MGVPDVLQAALWGLLAGSALVLGAAVAWVVPVPQRVVAAVMAFGSGVLISAVAFELVAEAYDRGGAPPTVLGFAAGAVIYTAANAVLARSGARHRKRSRSQPSEAQHGGSGLAIAVGALLDGVPESAVIGVSLLGGRGVGVATVVAIFISNLPEGLSSAAGMKASGRTASYVFGIWTGIAVVSGLAAMAGYAGGEALGDAGVAALTGLAAGAILAMLTDTMIPEAVSGPEDAGPGGGVHNGTGLIAGLGFLAAFLIGRLG